MMKLLIGLLLVGFSIESRAQLTCFECNNCGDPFDRNAHTAQSCPGLAPTTVTPPDTGTTTVEPPIPPSPEIPELTTSEPTAPTTTVAPDTTTVTVGPELTPPPIGRRKRQTESYRCYIMVNNGVTQRGCTPHGNDFAETCRTINAGQQPNDCRLCDYSECNSASGLTVSIMTLMATLLVVLKFF
ncbi:uncharacterized protein LOC134217192 [Armigeres subalbatus]|uniref:uncharacterized protein LOC134217192 n=1 Tax=Armigeres subalbatus TaxID=124917 RepID=UPI002ED666A1